MKKLFAMLLCMTMLLGLCACGAAKAPATEPAGTQAAAAMKTFTLTVVYPDGSSKDFTYTTAEEFVGPVLEKEGLIEGNAGPYGMEITQVDGETAVYNTDEAYWALYEGDAYALQGIDTTPVTDGGVYKLEYTRG